MSGGVTGIGSPHGLSELTVSVGFLTSSVHPAGGSVTPVTACVSLETLAEDLKVGVPSHHVICHRLKCVGPTLGRNHRPNHTSALTAESLAAGLPANHRPLVTLIRALVVAPPATTRVVNSSGALKPGEPEPRPVTTKTAVATVTTTGGSVATTPASFIVLGACVSPVNRPIAGNGPPLNGSTG